VTEPASSWERITALSMLGASRHGEALKDVLPDTSLKLPEGSKEIQVLRSAAAAYVWQLAGQRMAPIQINSVQSATMDARPLLSQGALRRLARMLANGPKQFIEEWFSLALNSGKVIPPQWLPAIFEALTPQARVPLQGLFGSRLEWLAALDQRWKVEGTKAQADDEVWAAGSQLERVELLKRLRASDAGLALLLLKSTWAMDGAEARETFLPLLKTGLSSEDEVFLEAALDDKRKGVRIAAADLLARLPNSVYTGRALARLEALFVFEAKSGGLLARLSSRKLRIELPESLDKAALRDGIEPKPPAGRKIGEKTFWLTQLLRIPPPQEWTKRFNCTAAELMEAVERTDFAQEILIALSSACARHPSADWVLALCAAWRGRLPDEQAGASGGMAALLGELLPAEREPQLRAQVEILRARGSLDAAIDLLNRVPTQWSASTTALAIEVLEKRALADRGSYVLARYLADDWSSRVDLPPAADGVRRMLEKLADDSGWRRPVEQFSELIEFRLDMHKELQS
jgi:Family of unknown function (DUF5691)